MAEYIDREAILRHLDECKGTPPEICYTYPIFVALECFVKNLPTADVAEVKHGKWKPYQTPIETRQSGWICTNCSVVVKDLSNGNSDFCPNCGAQMEDEA